MPEKINHTHIWSLESPNGSMSRGTCRVCNEQKDFPNAVNEQRGLYSYWAAKKKRNHGGKAL